MLICLVLLLKTRTSIWSDMEIGNIITVQGTEYIIRDIILTNSPNEFEFILSKLEKEEIERDIFGKLWYGFWFLVYYPIMDKIRKFWNERRVPDKDLPSITDQPCQCSKCGWSGTVWDTESIDDDGNLGCPECLMVIEVI